jgi:hypothetical protein
VVRPIILTGSRRDISLSPGSLAEAGVDGVLGKEITAQLLSETIQLPKAPHPA